MKGPAAPPLTVSAADRLVTTAFFALLVHGVVLLGVSFAPEDPGASSASPTLEITMVQAADDEIPDEAQYLAQVDQSGAGNTRDQVRPQSPLASPSPFDSPGDDQGDAAAERQPGEEEKFEDGGRTTTAETLPSGIVSTVAEAEYQTLSLPAPAPSTQSNVLIVAHLMDSSPDTLEPVDVIDQRSLAQSDEVREKFVSVNTREAVFAAYLDAWRDRIERMGNLHYPDEARRDGIYGSLVLEVALNANGTIRELKVTEASEYRILDRAAVRILRLASPFEPFPDPVRREADVLRFVYEWQFRPGGNESTLRAEPSG